MADLQATSDLARRIGLNYTGRLTHTQAAALAEAWRPEVRFHEDERFHPVDINGLFELPAVVYDTLTPGSQSEFAVEVDGVSYRPPVLRNGNTVLGNGDIEASDLDSTEVDSGTILTHGKSFNASVQYFGASTTINGQPIPTPGDPREPRHPIVYRAEMRMLYEALKYELELDDLNENEEKPADSIWRGFDVDSSFFREDRDSSAQAAFFPHQLKRQILKALADSYDPNNPDFAADNVAINAAVDATPEGWLFIRNAWEVIKNFAFVEYLFVYPYNDFDKYESPFGNKHEGDDEGCCVVFDRTLLNAMADDDQANPPESIAPHAFITSVHEEWQGSDRIDANISIDPQRARDDLVAYVARGSHATYLNAGTHDVLDFGDAFLLLFKGPTWGLVISALTLGLPGLFFAIAEHFADSEDQTSNDGVSTPGTTEASSESPLEFDAETIITALSDISDENDQNIYNSTNGSEPSDQAELLALGRRAYAGKIGGHDDTTAYSPNLKNKTARYFRKLLRAVESGAVKLPGPVIN